MSVKESLEAQAANCTRREHASFKAYTAILAEEMACGVMKVGTYNEALQSLPSAIIHVDDSDASLAAEIRVVEPDRVVVRDLYGQISDSGAISGIAEARNEAIDGNVGLMRWYARSNECRLGCGVVPHSDCRAIFCQ